MYSRDRARSDKGTAPALCTSALAACLGPGTRLHDESHGGAGQGFQCDRRGLLMRTKESCSGTNSRNCTILSSRPSSPPPFKAKITWAR
uniref:Secreted protein n=1 Tax=Mycena chlorophos TaxID=658473 RepID=A0ABQ0L843_MYCCL|nr:predicted protein [Mycena chlorophos]